MNYFKQTTHSEAIFLNPRLKPGTLPDSYSDLCDSIWSRIERKLPSVKPEQKREGFDNIMINLYKSKPMGLPVAYSRDNNHYSKVKRERDYPHYTYANITGVIDAMSNSLVHNYKGYYDQTTRFGERSRIEPGEEIASSFEQTRKEQIEMTKKVNVASVCTSRGGKLVMPNDTIKEFSKRTVIIKDGDYIPNRETRQMERFNTAYNKQIAESVILAPAEAESESLGQIVSTLKFEDTDDTDNLPGESNTHEHILEVPDALLRGFDTNPLCYKQLDCKLYRVFNEGSLRSGGRFYGADYQTMKSTSRRNILIDNEPVCECDFSALHITMLFNKLGQQLEGDPYDLFEDDIIRSAVKSLINIAINAKRRSTAINAFNYKLASSSADEEKQKNLNAMNQALIARGLDAERLLDSFLAKYPLIKQFLYTGEGLRLMNLDSRIAAKVLKHFHNKGITCLCVHDSFIVAQKYESELIEVMQRAYNDQMHFNCNIKSK